MKKEIKCNECASKDFIYAGLSWRKGVKNIRRHRCKSCGIIYVLSDDMLAIDEKEYNRRKNKRKGIMGG